MFQDFSDSWCATRVSIGNIIYLVRIQDVIGDIVAFQPAHNGGNIFFSRSKQICEVLNGKILTVLR
jgi:hypothetical protein